MRLASGWPDYRAFSGPRRELLKALTRSKGALLEAQLGAGISRRLANIPQLGRTDFPF